MLSSRRRARKKPAFGPWTVRLGCLLQGMCWKEMQPQNGRRFGVTIVAGAGDASLPGRPSCLGARSQCQRGE
eukprot:6751946-Lingulodinium_polyedra.AAC.1